MQVIHINTTDVGGGAEEFATDLSKRQNSFLIVKDKKSNLNNVIQLPPHYSDVLYIFFKKVLWKLGFKKSIRSTLGLREFGNFTLFRLRKIKEFNDAEIVHLHNIHGGYFDILSLPKIAKTKKIIWTMHDMSPFTGGEAYTFGGTEYQKGNEDDVDLSFYPLNGPSIDTRKYIMRVKKKIYNKISPDITFVSPSKIHLHAFKNSFVFNENIKSEHIYYGIDNEIFHNNDRHWNPIPKFLFFNSKSPFKNSELVKTILQEKIPLQEISVIGEFYKNPNPNMKIHNYGYVKSRKLLADILRKHDVFIFASKAESFGLFPVEASACGCYILYNNLEIFQEHLNITNGGEICTSIEEFEKMIKIILNKKIDLNEITRNASIQIKMAFDRKKAAQQYRDLYSHVLNNRF